MGRMNMTGRLRPTVTMFMLASVDGKTSTGPNDLYDFDKDLPKLPYTYKGLHQYYELEQKTSLWCMSSGKTQVKVLDGVELRNIKKSPASIIVVDSYHINDYVLERLSYKFHRVILASIRKRSFKCMYPNVSVEVFEASNLNVPPATLLKTLYAKYNITDICLQGGGTLNASFIREGLVDYIDIVVAPIIVGGSTVPSLVTGPNPSELSELKGLELLATVPMENNYARLLYRVLG